MTHDPTEIAIPSLDQLAERFAEAEAGTAADSPLQRMHAHDLAASVFEHLVGRTADPIIKAAHTSAGLHQRTLAARIRFAHRIPSIFPLSDVELLGLADLTCQACGRVCAMTAQGACPECPGLMVGPTPATEEEALDLPAERAELGDASARWIDRTTKVATVVAPWLTPLLAAPREHEHDLTRVRLPHIAREPRLDRTPFDSTPMQMLLAAVLERCPRCVLQMTEIITADPHQVGRFAVVVLRLAADPDEDTTSVPPNLLGRLRTTRDRDPFGWLLHNSSTMEGPGLYAAAEELTAEERWRAVAQGALVAAQILTARGV